MLAIAQLRNAEAHRTTGIATKVILEIVVQRVGLCHVAVNDELQVMTDAAARSVNAVLVVQLCHEIGCRVHRVAIGERGTVQIAVDARSVLVIAHLSATVKHHLSGDTATLLQLVITDGIQVNQPFQVRIADVLGYGKGEGKLTVLHLVATTEDHILAVIVDKGSRSLRGVVELAYHLFASIAHHD